MTDQLINVIHEMYDKLRRKYMVEPTSLKIPIKLKHRFLNSVCGCVAHARFNAYLQPPIFVTTYMGMYVDFVGGNCISMFGTNYAERRVYSTQKIWIDDIFDVIYEIEGSKKLDYDTILISSKLIPLKKEIEERYPTFSVVVSANMPEYEITLAKREF